ncbi:hypothetical protein [Marinomonas sp. PE14-40]|uniref:hypothetical protein n=1 Tax=Marinomonas sp. PE14-40 TaxID=3060621 RepID=UPI003F672CE6
MLNTLSSGVIRVWSGRVVALINSFILPPILLSTLGKYDLGLWLIITQVVALISIAEMGINTALSNKISKAIALNDNALISRYFRASLSYLLLLAVLLGLIFYFFMEYVIMFYEIKATSAFEDAFVLAILFSLMSLSIGFTAGFLQAYLKFGLLLKFQILQTTIQLISMLFVLLYFDVSLIYIVSAYFLPLIVVNFLKLLYVIFVLKVRFGLYEKEDFEALKSVLSLGSASFLLTFSSSMLYQGTTFIFAKKFGIDNLYLFSYPLLLLKAFMPFATSINRVFLPLLSRVDPSKRTQYLDMFSSVLKIMMNGCVLVFIAVVTFGFEFYAYWLSYAELNSSDLEKLTFITIVLFMGVPILMVSQLSRAILIVNSQHWRLGVIELSYVLIGFVIFWLFSEHYFISYYSFPFMILFVFLLKGFGFSSYISLKSMSDKPIKRVFTIIFYPLLFQGGFLVLYYFSNGLSYELTYSKAIIFFVSLIVFVYFVFCFIKTKKDMELV